VSSDRSKKFTKSKPPVLRVEQVRASCGHMTDFELFDDKKDQRFREDRRAKTASRPCPACRQKAHAERLAKEESARQEKERKQKERTEVQDKTQSQDKSQTGARRLPHGATFHVAYDATKMEWSGSLRVPDKGEFQAAATGVFKLLQQLDQQYWQAIEGTPGP
jgi:hypothetical protein